MVALFKTKFGRAGSWLKSAVSAYVKARGIARSIIDAIEAVILSTAIGAFIINKIKLWRSRRKLKKQLKNRGAENYYRDHDGPGMYDENGYRMTNTEIEKKNKELMAEIDELYMDDDIRDIVKLINKYDPDTFSGMTIDQQYRYVKDKEITFEEALKMFGLDKETQMKIAKINSDDTEDDSEAPDEPYQSVYDDDDEDEDDENRYPDEPEVSEEEDPSAWEEYYAKRKACMDAFSAEMHEGESNLEELEQEINRIEKKRKETKIYPDFDYRVFYEMMQLYGCEDFTVATSHNASKETLENYKKFSSRAIMTNAYINYVYCYKKARWTELMHIFKYDTNAMWRDLMRRYYYDEDFYWGVYKELHGKEGILNSNAKGHFSSNRPPILSLKDDALFVKVEKLCEKFEDELDDIREHIPASIRDDDFDPQLEDYKEFFGLDDDTGPVDMSGTEDILDQLDILRNGEANSIDEYMEKHQTSIPQKDPEPEQDDEDDEEEEIGVDPTIEREMIKKPVKMIMPEDDEPDEDPRELDDYGVPSVIVMAPNVYTLERRAKMMLDIYNKLYQIDPNLANIRIQNMLDDDERKNYHFFEISMIMQQYRKEDREHNLPFKMLPCDFHSKDEMLAVAKQFDTAVTIYGLDAWKKLIDDRTEFYRDKFEVETVDAMMRMLKDYDMEHSIKVDFVRYMYEAGYQNCIELANIDDIYQEALAHPVDRIQALYIDDYDGEEEFEESNEESEL